MAHVAKPNNTALQRQAWLAAGGALSVWLIGVAFVAAAAWAAWQRRGAGLELVALSLLVFGVASALFDLSLRPIRGYLAERRVSAELAQLPDEYWLLNDVQINARGQATQIDHVLVSPHGLWCIETKSHLGWIFGQRRDRTWTRVKRSERGRTHKEQMRNPVQQNEWQRSQLDEYLKQRLGLRCPTKCLVVLTAARLMKPVQNAVYLRDLRREVQRADTKQHLNEEQVRAVLDALLADKP